MSVLRVLWCRATFRHLGRVHYTIADGPWWQCDNCGEVVR